MPTKSPELRAHQEWLGYLQPLGVVVTPPALLSAQAQVHTNIIPLHARFLEWVQEIRLDEDSDPVQAVTDLPGLLSDVFDWRIEDLIGHKDASPLADSLEAALPEYNETLRPTYAVKEVEPEENGSDWLMLIKALDLGTGLDEIPKDGDRGWQASPTDKLERLLRETDIPTGVLFNGTHLRLIYAPKGETSGHLTFPVQAMTEVSGRPIFAGLHLLLAEDRLFSLPRKQRLPAILEESRKYQNVVSTQLSEQVLNALHELLRGFQAANEYSQGELLSEVLRKDPNHVYAGLLTVLLRLVFILYAEDRGLISDDPVYVRHYSIAGLFERLRSDANRYPDTMDQRYGAWAQLLALFRMVHDGAKHGKLHLHERRGYLFNPDRYRFLEGAVYGVGRVMGEAIDPPKVSDGVVFRVLQDLMILDGERISYRNLDVEQIGSVYETMMGFNLEVAEGKSIALKPTKAHGAPVTIDIEALLEEAPGKRAKRIQDRAEQKITGQALKGLKAAKTPEEVVAAIEKKVSPTTPNIIPKAAMVLQPSDERRKSGSHYTPRSLTEPIVQTTLRPVLERLGERPSPEDILDLKICDPAMGSGAFLVEACRQLADKLVEAWHMHDCTPKIPPDEDEFLHAMRLVSQRCLYGVDKNPMAADLAKMSLWLATLARDHPFTFVDHALRHGDSLVGLTKDQIATFQWPGGKQMDLLLPDISERIQAIEALRDEIRSSGDTLDDRALYRKLNDIQDAVNEVRMVGDLAISAFFLGKKKKLREDIREQLVPQVRAWLESGEADAELRGRVDIIREGPRAVVPFHWEIEFPEVFDRKNSGFDAFVGNPPFGGKNTTINSNPPGYLDWLKELHEESHGNADIVAHFFRRTFGLLRQKGALGLVATNTIAQGDTRSTGLRWICQHEGTIYSARRRMKWPGQAAVVVSVVHIGKGQFEGPCILDGKNVPSISAFLFHAGGHDNPVTLVANAGKSFIGSYVLGMGFTFDDTDTKGVASPISEMERLIKKDPRNRERIFPYIGGEEVNSSPTHAHHRYVINFGQMSEEEARQWPDLMAIVEERVKGTRASHSTAEWWHFERYRQELYDAIRGMDRVLVVAQTSNTLGFAFKDTRTVFGHTLVVFPFDRYSFFSTVQSRIHKLWALFFAAKMKDDARYIPSDCFETFPFPVRFESNPKLEEIGQRYYEFRADLMVQNDEGLTKTYNRFHDPDERSADIVKLRELHAEMDRAVLDAYGWTDLEPTHDFLLDYEEEEDEEEASRKRKKPWRYRWPDDFHDEVLARLLELNKERAEEERLAGLSTKTVNRKSAVKKDSKQESLFD